MKIAFHKPETSLKNIAFFGAGLGLFLAGAIGIIRDFSARPLTTYIVTSTREAAAENLLNCGNVSIEFKRQADAYAAARPGTHVFEVQIRELQ